MVKTLQEFPQETMYEAAGYIQTSPADHDMRTDKHGNRYLPVRMDGKDLPQRGQPIKSSHLQVIVRLIRLLSYEQIERLTFEQDKKH